MGWGRVFCDGLSPRLFPVVVCVGKYPGLLSFVPCPLACCLLPVFPPTELPFPRPLLLFDMHGLCLDVDMLSPAVVLHGPPLLLCLLPSALSCPRRHAHELPKMIGPRLLALHV